MTVLEHYKLCGGMRGVSLRVWQSIISSGPGTLRGGFLEEAWYELSLDGKERLSQANKKKKNGQRHGRQSELPP